MVPTFLPFWPQHIAFFHTHMHHWLQSTVQWVCLSKHPPGYGWKWQRSYQIHSQMLGRGKHQLKANNQKWNVKSCVQIWILTTCLHESQKVWNRSYSRVWTTNESNRHQKNRHDSLHPHLSMSPCISLLPLWDTSREEAASEARPVFRAYRWRLPSVRYLWGEIKLQV